MLCFEWWCYELAAFVTGAISITQLAIHTVIMQILSLNFMVSSYVYIMSCDNHMTIVI